MCTSLLHAVDTSYQVKKINTVMIISYPPRLQLATCAVEAGRPVVGESVAGPVAVVGAGHTQPLPDSGFQHQTLFLLVPGAPLQPGKHSYLISNLLSMIKYIQQE